MIEYSFWINEGQEGVEALVFTSEFNQARFTRTEVLKEIVNQFPEGAKGTTKALVLPDPVVSNALVYNGTSKGRKYLTVITHADGEGQESDVHTVKGVKSIPYTISERGVSKIEVLEVKKGENKPVFEMVL